MQISIDTEILDSIFTPAANAARFVGDIDDDIVGDALTKWINEINRLVSGLLGKPYDPQLTEAPTQDGEPEFSVEGGVNLLRELIARVDALANAAQSHLDEMILDEKDQSTSTRAPRASDRRDVRLGSGGGRGRRCDRCRVRHAWLGLITASTGERRGCMAQLWCPATSVVLRQVGVRPKLSGPLL